MKSSLLEEQAEILLLKYNFLADFTAALTAARSVANMCLWTVSRMALQRRSALLRFRQAALAASFNQGTEGRSLIRLVIKGAWRSRIWERPSLYLLTSTSSDSASWLTSKPWLRAPSESMALTLRDATSHVATDGRLTAMVEKMAFWSLRTSISSTFVRERQLTFERTTT